MNTDQISELNSQENSSPSATRLPSLNALRCFEAAARHQHFGRAGDELHLTHGAISRAVALLEADLGLPLFERRQRRVYLTDAGRALAQSVTEALQDMRRTTERLRAQARQPRGWTLSCEPTLLMRWLRPRWPGLQALHPALHFRLLAGGGAQSLDDAGIDLAVRRDDFDWPARFTAEPLFAERIGLVCRPAPADAWFRGGVLQVQAPRLHTRTRSGAWDDWARCTGAAPDARRGPGAGVRSFLLPPASRSRRSGRGHGATAPGARRPGQRPAGGAARLCGRWLALWAAVFAR